MPVTLAFEDYQWLALGLEVIRLLFVMAVGACLGSLINVLAFRMPRGLDVVSTPSACPSCGTKLTFRENIPIFGWLILRGRCRFCRDKISPEYPIVESLVAVLFGVFYIVWYLLHDTAVVRNTVFLCVDFGSIAPGYVQSGLGATWPAFVLLLVLLACLVAMTIIDAKTFTIPLILAWIPTGLALVVHVGWAAWLDYNHSAYIKSTQNELWIIPTPGMLGWWWIGASIGAVVGLVFSNILLSTGLIKRSFADYDQWEASVRAEEERLAATAGAAPSTPATPSESEGASKGGEPAKPRVELWIQYPRARREALRELLFLAPCLGLGMACGGLAERLWGAKEEIIQVAATATTAAHSIYSMSHGTAPPRWLVVLAGVLMGYLIGGGLVWGTRILGTLGTGKEAMGLGDVHLLAAVGACLGWIDAVLTFFGAAFVALAWALLGRVFSGRLQRLLPFGPHLAVAAVLVLLLKPLIEKGLTVLFHAETPIQLP